jgi:Sec-independent protein secretion pathway component TatC
LTTQIVGPFFIPFGLSSFITIYHVFPFCFRQISAKASTG